MSLENTRYIQRKLERDALNKQKSFNQSRTLTNQLSTDTSYRTSADNITYTQEHALSMVDALTKVRENKSTVKDGLHMMPSNHGGPFL